MVQLDFPANQLHSIYTSMLNFDRIYISFKISIPLTSSSCYFIICLKIIPVTIYMQIFLDLLPIIYFYYNSEK